MRAMLRVLAGVGGVAFALLVVVVPTGGVLTFLSEPGSSPHGFENHWLLSWAAYVLTILTFVIFCGLASAVLLRYARRGSTGRSITLR